MSNKNHYSVILVASTSHALQVERALVRADIACKLIPVPRQLSSDCGVCVRIRQDDKNVFPGILKTSGIIIDGVYDV